MTNPDEQRIPDNACEFERCTECVEDFTALGVRNRRASLLWLETLLLLLGGANFLYFVVLKSASFDISQRVAAGIAFVSLAFLVAQIVYNRRIWEATKPAPPNDIDGDIGQKRRLS